MKINGIVKDKRILIWGYGMEGKCLESFLKSHCEAGSISVYEGPQSGIDEDAYDLILKSPGIREEHYNEKYSSMTELFLYEFRDRTIGITGTKGKSTTSSLMAHCLSACGKKVILAGNIGIPCLGLYDEIDEDTTIVFEMSCHQLDHIRVSPHVGVFLNLYEEHLDHYSGFEAYFRAKAGITLNQKESDVFIPGPGVPSIDTKARIMPVEPLPDRVCLKLKGEHNRYNAAVVYTVCREIFGCDDERLTASMAEFSGLRHRLEYLGNKDGIDFYDDSISTIPAAAIAALKSIDNAATILIGGMDRHIDYKLLEEFILEHPEYTYIFMYESGSRIYEELGASEGLRRVNDLKEAVALAREITPAGKACLLSPAAASYGYFKNFEERGDVFRRLAGLEEKQETEIAFTGDIGFDHFMDHKWEDEELLDPEIVKFLTSADHVAANVEGPLVGKDAELVEAREMRLMHTIDPAAVSVLDRIRADIWNLCNNHIMDAGQEGLKLSIKAAKDHGVSTLGVGMNIKEACRPVILDEAGGIGLFAVGYRRGCKPASDETGGCLCWNEMERIAAVIKDIKAKCHWCIVVAHGGEEFTALPSPYTRKRYLDYLEMGADLVVCHHPHVPMNYELVGEKAIFYSLGNFIFDTPYQRAQLYTECGILLKIKLTHESWSFEALGLKTDRDKERVVKADLPDIFENVPEEEYELLSPLSAKAFVAATKRQQIFLHPDEFADASEDKWKEHFADPKRSGRVEGEGLDFFIICPLAERTAEGLHERSRLKKVKDHIMRMM